MLPASLVQRGVALRATALEDRAFLRALYATARPDAAVLSLWPASQREAFLDSQFAYRETQYGRYHPAADRWVLMEHGRPIGRLVLDRARHVWTVVDVALVPAARGRGVGAALLRAVQDGAGRAGGVDVALQVDVSNRARALYRRLGFRDSTAGDGPYVEMTWRSGTTLCAGSEL